MQGNTMRGYSTQANSQRRRWPHSRTGMLLGAGLLGVAMAGRPLIARSFEAAGNAVQERVIAGSPLLDQALVRADEALDLRLSAAQQQQIKPLLAAAARQGMALHEDAALAPAAKKARLKALLEATRTQLVPLLTAEQRAKLDAAQRHLTGLQLDLSAQQRAALRPIALHAFEQARAVQQDNTLTPRQKLPRFRRIALAARRDGVKILSPRQLRQLAGLGNSPVVVNVLTKELELTAAQRARVRDIAATATQRVQSGDASLSMAQFQQRCISILGQSRQQLRAVLTAPQNRKLDRLIGRA